MCTTDAKSSNAGSNAVSFAMGTAIGTGLGVFLSTKKGKRLIKKAWNQLEPYLDDVVESARDEFEDIKEKSQDIKVEAQVKSEQVKSRSLDQFNHTLDEVKELAEDKLPPFIKKPVKRTFFKGI